MVKDGRFRLDRSSSFIFGLKSPLVVSLCALLLVQPAIGIAQEPAAKNPQQPTGPQTTEISSSQPPSSVDELPSAPVPQSSSQSPQQNQPAQQPNNTPQQQVQPAQQPNTPAQQIPPAQPSNTPQQPNAPQQPVGTAAAPYEKPTGVSGSRPAGAAIAPAKQRRVRAIVISLAVILAGAGAIGAVAGMSKASHSQP